jgi:hypothetical protein
MKSITSHFSRVYVLGVLVILVACGGAPTATSQPTVQILAPSYGASFVQGETVAVQSLSSDNSGIARVELYVDGQLANTKLAPSAQGEKQFTIVQEWRATGLGAHTIVVRAFNTANVSGETSFPIAVNPQGGASPTTIAQITPPLDATPQEGIDTVTPLPADETATPLPETLVAETEIAPTDVPPTGVPPTDIPPTANPPTAIPPTLAPTATIPPLAYQLPSDGGMSVFVDWSENGLQMEAQANDVEVGQENGDGIAYVEFFIQRLDGSVIATKRENMKPYCFFGEQDGECLYGQQGESNFNWNGKPIQAGWYFIRAVSHTPDNRIQVAERPLRITYPPDSFENLFVNIVEPSTDRPELELVFEADVSGAATDAGVDRVEMFVVTYDGKIVHARAERNPRYCAFGGGDNGAPCPVYNFRSNGLKWSSGASINPTQYVLRAVAYTSDGIISASTFVIQIDRVQ